jgi:CheY-like chemotaxis protein
MTPPDTEKAESSRGTILIVDDAMDMRVFISALFKTNGYHTETCRDGSAGLAKAREIAPDLIVLDVMMPGSGGALMYKSLKTDRQLQKIPIIMLSAVGHRSFQHYLKCSTSNWWSRCPILTTIWKNRPMLSSCWTRQSGSWHPEKSKNGRKNPAGR